MLAFLKGLHQEQVNAVQSIALGKEPHELTQEVAVIKTRLNMCSLLFNLPANIQALKDQFEQQTEQKLKIVKSQEGGSI